MHTLGFEVHSLIYAEVKYLLWKGDKTFLPKSENPQSCKYMDEESHRCGICSSYIQLILENKNCFH